MSPRETEITREEFICNNMKLMYSIANRFINRGIERDDLYQVATIGLIKAVDNFNPEFNVQFSTYAVPMIIGEIKRYCRDNTTLHISRSIKELAQKANEMCEEIRKQSGCEPTVKDIAQKLSVTPEELGAALAAVQYPVSIDEVQPESETTLKATIPDKNNQIDLAEALSLKELICTMPEREQNIIRWRYIFEYSQSKIADMLGISQVQVSRLEKKILTFLRNNL